jgi:hypothetical protein
MTEASQSELSYLVTSAGMAAPNPDPLTKDRRPSPRSLDEDLVPNRSKSLLALDVLWRVFVSALLIASFVLSLVALIRTYDPLPPYPTAFSLGGQLAGTTAYATVLAVGNATAAQIDQAVYKVLSTNTTPIADNDTAIGFSANFSGPSLTIQPGTQSCVTTGWYTSLFTPFQGNYGVYNTGSFDNATGVFTTPLTAVYAISVVVQAIPVPGGSGDRQLVYLDLQDPAIVGNWVRIPQAYTSVPGSFTSIGLTGTMIQRLPALQQFHLCIVNNGGEVLFIGPQGITFSIERVTNLA